MFIQSENSVYTDPAIILMGKKMFYSRNSIKIMEKYHFFSEWETNRFSFIYYKLT